MNERTCAWCKGPIAANARDDSKYCRTLCRQAAWRFGGGAPQRVAHGQPRRFAYADPPYPGKSKRYYQDHPDFGGEVDHRALVERLMTEFPDGWALSTDSRSLQDVLASCPPGVRIAGWFRGERPTRSRWPLAAWEPVIVHSGRPYLLGPAERRLDALVHVSRPRLTDNGRVMGSKPAKFAYWLFDLLGALPGDDLVDLFPGSGGIGRAWDVYNRRRSTADMFGANRRPAPVRRDESSASSAIRVAKVRDDITGFGPIAQAILEGIL